MKKRMVAVGMAVLTAAMACFPAQAAWVKKDGREDGKKWRYQSDTGEYYEKNVLRPSGGRWWWIGEDTWLMTGHGGEKVKTEIGGVSYTLTLYDSGEVSRECVSETGETVDIYDLLGPGYGAMQRKYIEEWKEVPPEDGKPGAWFYHGADGYPIGSGVHRIPENGSDLFYMIGAEGEYGHLIKEQWGHRSGYYAEPRDYNLVINKWIPDGNDWYYFGEDGKKLTGVQEVDGVEYDFGTTGAIPAKKLNFPEVTAVTLGEYEKTAYVGDVVSIPFTVTVKQPVATSSNADEIQYEEVEADYSIFETMYSVGNNNRYNMDTENYTTKADVLQLDKSPMDRRYEIDWASKEIRIPVDKAGTAYGTFTIKGATKQIQDKSGFVIQCRYPESMSDEGQIGELFGQLNEGRITTAEMVSSLKGMDKASLKTVIVNNKILVDDENDSELGTVQEMLKSLEFLHNEGNKIKTYVNVNNAVASQIKTSAVKVVGLGLSANANTEIGLHVGESNESLPEEIADKKAVAFDLKVMVDGKNKKALEVPAVITMPKPRDIGSDDFVLYHLNDGVAEEVEYHLDSAENLVTFTADSFSAYIFTEEAEQNTNTGSTGSSRPKPKGSGSGAGTGAYTGTKKIGPDGSAAMREWTGGQWKMDETGWWYQGADGTYPKNTWASIEWNGQRYWYHFNESGYMDTGWILDSEIWYYLHPEANGNRGHMYTGWHEIGGKWYYFNMGSELPMGAMLANTTTPDGYQVDGQGAWIQ